MSSGSSSSNNNSSSARSHALALVLLPRMNLGVIKQAQDAAVPDGLGPAARGVVLQEGERGGGGGERALLGDMAGRVLVDDAGRHPAAARVLRCATRC